MRQIIQQDTSRQHEPSPSLRDEDATRSMNAGKNSGLKKQTQFVQGQNAAMSYIKRDYDNILACETEENKANQSQFLYRQPLSSDIMTKLCR
jgi:hypothetical protein